MPTTYKVSQDLNTLLISWNGRAYISTPCRAGYHLTQKRLSHAANMINMRDEDIDSSHRVQSMGYPTAARLLLADPIGWSVEHAIHWLLGSLASQKSKQTRAEGARAWLRARASCLVA